MNREDFKRTWNMIIAKAWADEDYKARLLKSPTEILTEEGIEVPEGMEIRVLESTPQQTWLVLPAAPEEREVQEGEERLAATGWSQ